MRSPNRSTPDRGFILLEALLALALAGAAFVGAAGASRSNAYWLLSSRAILESMPVVAADIARLADESTADFFSVRSSFVPDAPSCTVQGSCDGLHRTVTDISRCAKWVEVSAERHFPGYPATTASAGTYLSDFAQIVALGGDCELAPPTGDWGRPQVVASADLGTGNPTGLDVLGDVTYVTADSPPYLRIVTPQGPVAFTNGFSSDGPYTAIDVARDLATGRTYAFLTAVTPQLQVVEVTDPTAPVLVGIATLRNVTLTGAQAQGWRVTVYGTVAYVTARYMLAPNPELHLFDISDPTRPRELGSGTKLNTSVYGMVVREQMIGGSMRRVLYAAATLPSGELKAYDVTDPLNVSPLASCDLPGSYQATSLSMLGTRLFVGREAVPSGGADLYVFDASDPTTSAFCTPMASTDITTDAYSRHVQALSVAGPYLFVATTNTTGTHGQLQVRSTVPTFRLALLGSFTLPMLAENALDFENGRLYVANAGGTTNLQSLTPSP